MALILLLYLLAVCGCAHSCGNGSSIVLESPFHSGRFGTVQVCLNGSFWHTICTDFWDNQDASVVCRQLGHSPYGAIGPSKSAVNSRIKNSYINDINCTGNEANLLDCPFNGLTNYSCANDNRYASYCLL
jgi:hypothetical protein